MREKSKVVLLLRLWGWGPAMQVMLTCNSDLTFEILSYVFFLSLSPDGPVQFGDDNSKTAAIGPEPHHLELWI